MGRVPFAGIVMNLSASQFRDPQLGERILNAILRRSGEGLDDDSD